MVSLPALKNRGSAFAAVVVLLSALLPNVALAEATVVVRVRGEGGAAVDGTVELSDSSSGRRFACTTSGGTCTIGNVPGGRYQASVTTPAGTSRPRAVMIPPDGEATVVLSAS